MKNYKSTVIGVLGRAAYVAVGFLIAVCLFTKGVL